MELKVSAKAKLKQCVGQGYGTDNPHLDVERKQLIVTNGHALVVLPVKVGEDEESGPVPVAAIMPTLRKVRLGEKRPTLECRGTVVLTEPSGITTIYPREQKRPFPNWLASAITEERPRTISLNARLLADVQNAFGCEFVDLYIGEQDKAIVVAPMGRHVEGYGLVMPSRSNATTFPQVEAVK